MTRPRHSTSHIVSVYRDLRTKTPRVPLRLLRRALGGGSPQRLLRIVQTQRGRLVLQVQQAFHLAERMALEERLLHHYQDAITKVRAENRELRAEVRRLQAALRDAEIVIEGLDDGGEDRIDTVSPSPEPSDESTSSRGLPS